jgi:hypothetical protein
MYLDAVNNISEEPQVSYGTTSAARAISRKVEPLDLFEPWRHWPISEISHHGAQCCEASREWLLAMDISELGGESVYAGPRWLKKLFSWGASEFPIYWCEAVRKDQLDCGALAALAYELFRARGVATMRVQMVQKFTERSIDQWKAHWGSDADLNWTASNVIYHEGCAIFTGSGELKIWDSSAGWWVEPSATSGYGALLALRISDRKLINHGPLEWKGLVLDPFIWTAIDSD